MELHYQPLLAEHIPLIQSTELSEIDEFFELQRDIERQEIEHELTEDYLFGALCENDAFFGENDHD